MRLLEPGVPGPGGAWADLGSGTGAFTLALAQLVGPAATVLSVDKNAGALAAQQAALRARFPTARVEYRTADFCHPLGIAELDGVVMANSLHFVRHKQSLLKLVLSYLKPGGSFILVEYNTDRGNPWVPFPVAYETWCDLATSSGYEGTRLLATVPSSFLGQIYSAISLKPYPKE